MFAKRIYEEKKSGNSGDDLVEVFVDEIELTDVVNNRYLMTWCSVVNDEAIIEEITDVINPDFYMKSSDAIRQGIRMFDTLINSHPSLGAINQD